MSTKTSEMKIVPIPKALSPRMALVAEHLSKRLGPDAGGWADYKASEGLVGRLTKPADQGYNLSADFHRPNDPKTTIALSFLSMLNIEAGQDGQTIVLQDNMIERKTIEVDIPENVEVSKEVSHTFETTESFSEAFTRAHKEAWEAGGKASLSLGYGGISGAVEAWGKYGQENNESHSGSHEKASRTSDTVTETFKFKGPVQFHVEAYRSRRRERKTLRALANLWTWVQRSNGVLHVLDTVYASCPRSRR